MDGVLYSCDFSIAPRSDPNKDVVFTLDDVLSLGDGRRASHARARLEAARRSLKDKQQAKKALEAALRLSAPVKDDLSLAEELSKSEGLMTRTGLKRVAATDSIAAGSGGNSSVVSIPFAKTKKSDSKKAAAKSRQSPVRPALRDSTQKSAEPKSKKTVSTLVKQENRSRKSAMPAASTQSQTAVEFPKEESPDISSLCSNQVFLLCEEPTRLHYVPCGCDRSPSSALEFAGKGWEGTATLYHGSRLRFGCLQFILSIVGQPGHRELIKALRNRENYDL